MLEMLREARESKSSIFMKFNNQFKENKNAFFCFFEGDDSKYYGFRIKNSLPIDIETIYFTCNGKKAVLEVKDLILSKRIYEEAYKAFFIDRDFDPRVNCDSNLVYETPYYSIENFYVQKEVIEEIYKVEFKLDSSTIDYKKCINLFVERQKEYHESIKLLNAWLACQQDLRNQGIKTNFSLNNFKINDFVEISLEKVNQKYNLKSLSNSFPDAYNIPENKVYEKLEYWDRYKPSQVFRGKFEIDFLRLFLNLLIDDQCSKTPTYFEKKKTNSFRISNKNILSELSQYAVTHPTLNSFIKSVFMKNHALVSG